MFNIHMLPAGHGDCLAIEYGTSASRPRHIVIDGGPDWSYVKKGALRERIRGIKRIELLVITHVDADHIGGVVELLRDQSLDLDIGDIWFNGWQHLPKKADDLLGAVQGEMLSALIEENFPKRWNKAFGGKACAVPIRGKLPVLKLDGGMELTLLSPTPAALAQLRPKWEKEVKKAGLVPGSKVDALKELERRKPKDLLGGEQPDVGELAAEPSTEDVSVANGSSIALLARYGKRSCVLAGDAHPGPLAAALRRAGATGKSADALKMSHHASAGSNTSPLLDGLAARQYLVSTNGGYYEHPDPQAIARVLAANARRGGDSIDLRFNYHSKFNEMWEDPGLQAAHDYVATYPAKPLGGLEVQL